MPAPATHTDMTAPVPCDGCRRAPRCAAQWLACSAFVAYAEGAGQPRWRLAPTLDLSADKYRSLFREAR